ncbi:MAG: nitroreductase family protein [Bacillota bacterium]
MKEFGQYVSELVSAVETRKSRRKYSKEGLTAEHMQQVKEFAESIETPFDNTVVISIHSLSGSSVCHFAEPETFAAICSPDTLVDQAKAGFVGELLILFCESIGIGTCWYGHYKKKNAYDIVYGASEEKAPKKIQSVTPLGYCSEKPTGVYDKLTDIMFSRKKNTVEQNLHKDSIKELPHTVRYALELACKAPSAMNSQCWYFNVQKQSEDILVEIAKPAGYKHIKWAYPDIDVGTCAAHFWLGLLKQGAEPKVSVQQDGDRAVWKFQL